MTKTALVDAVRGFITGDATLGEVNQELLLCERDDILGQAAVRYLLNQGRWDFSAPQSDAAMNHLFGHFPGRAPLVPADYVRETRALINEHWGVDIADPTPRVSVAAEPEAAESKPRKGKGKAKDGGESGSKRFKSLAEHGEAETEN